MAGYISHSPAEEISSLGMCEGYFGVYELRQMLNAWGIDRKNTVRDVFLLSNYH